MKTDLGIKEEKLEEMSAMGAGAVSGVPVKGQEEALRKAIRRSIKVYSKNKNKVSQEQIKEQKLRTVIRNLLKEQEETVSQNKTWMNVLSDLLNYMIPLMRDKYVQLQTNMDERQGFKDTVNVYFEQQFRQIDNTEEVEQEKLEEEEAEREANMSDVDKIKLRVKSSNPDFIDIDDGSSKGTPKQKKKEPEGKNAQSYQESGSQFAEEFIKSIGDRVRDDYSRKIPANTDRDDFKRTFFSNLTSWYEIWDENEPVSGASEEFSSDLEDTSIQEPEEVEQGDEIPPSPESELEEDFGLDLLEILDSDLE